MDLDYKKILLLFPLFIILDITKLFASEYSNEIKDDVVVFRGDSTLSDISTLTEQSFTVPASCVTQPAEVIKVSRQPSIKSSVYFSKDQISQLQGGVAQDQRQRCYLCNSFCSCFYF